MPDSITPYLVEVTIDSGAEINKKSLDELLKSGRSKSPTGVELGEYRWGDGRGLFFHKRLLDESFTVLGVTEVRAVYAFEEKLEEPAEITLRYFREFRRNFLREHKGLDVVFKGASTKAGSLVVEFEACVVALIAGAAMFNQIDEAVERIVKRLRQIRRLITRKKKN